MVSRHRPGYGKAPLPDDWSDSGASGIGKLAEGVGFEPTEGLTSPVFKTGAINHSATLPKNFGTATGFDLSRTYVLTAPSSLAGVWLPLAPAVHPPGCSLVALGPRVD